MNRKLTLFMFMLMSCLVTSAGWTQDWIFSPMPRVITGGTVGYFRVSLDNFNDLYSSRWDTYYSGQVSVRFYHSTYASFQYATFTTAGKTVTVEGANLTGQADWQETFMNIGLRRYSDTNRKWRFFTGVGFIFIDIEEAAGISIFANKNSTDTRTKGSGFYLEIGGDYRFIPHAAIGWEIEANSAGEGGNPGFAGSNLGGLAFQVGLSLDY
ncbi:MAG: hypothetical protein ACOY90_11005 [Candidatus Zhuqueibacterota bacterium]